MKKMTIRERMLAVVQGKEHDQVPFVMYEIMFPPEQAINLVGHGNIGLLRFCSVFRVDHPHCAFDTRIYYEGEQRMQRKVLHTPKGDLVEIREFEPIYDSSVVRRYFIETPQDYEKFWSYLEDCTILENYDQYHRDAAELGDDGLPKGEIERTPWQQLWIEWVGLQALSLHLMDYPDHVERSIDLLTDRVRQMFEIAYYSPAPFIDIPDNITAPAIGAARFRKYCAPLYDELAEMLAERDAQLYIHMDGMLKPLWKDISASLIGGLDSFAQIPEGDTTLAEAVELWPDKKLWANPPTAVHMGSPDEIRAAIDDMLYTAGHTGRLQIQISENIPVGTWRKSFPIIVEAIKDFGTPEG